MNASRILTVYLAVGGSVFTIVTSAGGEGFTLATSGAGVVTSIGGEGFTIVTGAAGSAASAATSLAYVSLCLLRQSSSILTNFFAPLQWLVKRRFPASAVVNVHAPFGWYSDRFLGCRSWSLCHLDLYCVLVDLHSFRWIVRSYIQVVCRTAYIRLLS